MAGLRLTLVKKDVANSTEIVKTIAKFHMTMPARKIRARNRTQFALSSRRSAGGSWAVKDAANRIRTND